jgi:hypothetical protein
MIFSGNALTCLRRFQIACTKGLDHAIQNFISWLRLGGPEERQKELRGLRMAGLMIKWSTLRKPRALKPLHLGCLVATLVVSAPVLNLCAQQLPNARASDQGLADAPGMAEPAASSDVVSPPQRFSSSISGAVIDANGDAIAGARVALAGTVNRVVESGSNGEFAFSELPPGSFRLTVTSTGMEAYISSEIPLRLEDVQLLPRIVLHIAATTTEIRVSGDANELAEEQVHIAVEQRVLGVLPNFYSSYDWNAPPLGPRQKFTLAFRATTDPVAFLGAGVYAGFEQGLDIFPGYGLGAKGYAKRFSAEYTDDATGRILGSAVLPALLHQDPRYFYRGSGSFTVRAAYAIGAAFFCRGDNGHWQPNYSHVLGSFASGALSNLYYPSGSRGVSLTLVNGLLETVGNAGNNLLREFIYKGLTTHVPTYANGKP